MTDQGSVKRAGKLLTHMFGRCLSAVLQINQTVDEEWPLTMVDHKGKIQSFFIFIVSQKVHAAWILSNLNAEAEKKHKHVEKDNLY